MFRGDKLASNKELIFDIDGTLWNASESTAKGINCVMERMGLPNRVTDKNVESVAGKPYSECIEIMLPGLIKNFPDLLEQTNLEELKYVTQFGGIFYNGVLDGIKELSKTHNIYVISNCQAWYLDLFLEKSGLGEYIQDADCNGLSGNPKDVMISNMVIKHNMKNPVYIGDTIGDESSAIKSGVEFNYVSYGFGSIKGTHRTFHTFSDIVKLYK